MGKWTVMLEMELLEAVHKIEPKAAKTYSPRFELGEVVYRRADVIHAVRSQVAPSSVLRNTPPWIILERTQQECPGGYQFHYLAGGWGQDRAPVRGTFLDHEIMGFAETLEYLSDVEQTAKSYWEAAAQADADSEGTEPDADDNASDDPEAAGTGPAGDPQSDRG